MVFQRLSPFRCPLKKIIKISLLTFITFGLLAFQTFDCQAQGVSQWENNYGGSDRDKVNAIEITQDSGYIMAGETWSTDHDVTDTTGYPNNYWIVKLDKTGIIEWEKAFGGSDWDFAKSVKQTPKGNYIVAGRTSSSDLDISNNYGGKDIWVLKLDSNGNILWKRNYGGSDDESASKVVVTDDNNYVIAGYTESEDQDVCNNYKAYPDYWLLKLNDTGTILWEKCFGGSSIDEAYDLTKTNDKGFIMAGVSSSSDEDVSANYGERDFWVVKVDSAGNLEWENNYGGSKYENYPLSIENVDNNGYVLAGKISGYDSATNHDIPEYYGNDDIWVAKLDKTGTLIWSKNYGGSSVDEVETIQPLSYGGFIIGGMTASEDHDVSNKYGDGELFSDDYWLARLNEEGNMLWENNYGGSGNDNCEVIKQIGDSSFIAGGFSTSDDIDVTANYGDKDIWLFNFEDTNCPVYNSVDIEACKDFQISGSGKKWESTSYYKDTFKTTANCDSIVTIDLRIIREEMDTSVTKAEGTLKAELQSTSYQWLNCDNSFLPVDGATDRIFTPMSTGSYAVKITKDGCSDTSGCYKIKTTNIQEKEAEDFVKFYPNPVEEELTVKTGFPKDKNIKIKLFSLYGKEIRKLKTEGLTNHIYRFNLNEIAPGPYFLKVVSEDVVITRKLIVN